MEVQIRVGIIFNMLTGGASRSQILQYAAKDDPEKGKRPWGLSDSAIDKYIGKATALYRESASIDHDQEIGRQLASYNLIYSSCIRKGDYKGALEAKKAVAALFGLNAPAKIDMTTYLTIQDALAREKEIIEIVKEAIRAAADTETTKKIMSHIQTRITDNS